MSVNQTVLSCLPSTVTVSSAESGVKAALASWKMSCASWDQETADAVGKASINYAINWNNAVMPEIDAKISRLQSEYEEKKAEYDAVNDQYKESNKAIQQAQKDMDSCMDYKDDRNWHGSGMFAGMQSSGGVSASPREKVIVDHIGYAEAKKREGQAKAETNRYKGQLDICKKQMNTVESNLSKAKKEKGILAKKIEDFILDIYQLNLLNESVPFLLNLKNSSIELSSVTKEKLFSRLFFIQNQYREEFVIFENSVKSAGDKYIGSFSSKPGSLTYSAEQKVKAKKFKGNIIVLLESSDISSAKMSYHSKNEFIIPSKKLDEAQQKIQSQCKNYQLNVDRNHFTIELCKEYLNDSIKNEIGNILSRYEEYMTEYITILDEFLENGASSSKLRIFIGKIGNRFAHAKAKREAYKKMSPEERKAAKKAEKEEKLRSKNEKKTTRRSNSSDDNQTNEEKSKKKLALLLVLIAILFYCVLFLMLKK